MTIERIQQRAAELEHEAHQTSRSQFSQRAQGRAAGILDTLSALGLRRGYKSLFHAGDEPKGDKAESARVAELESLVTHQSKRIAELVLEREELERRRDRLRAVLELLAASTEKK